MKNQQGIVWTPVLIMIGVVVVTGVAAYILFQASNTNEAENRNVAVVNQANNDANVNTNTVANTNTASDTNTASNPTSGWKTYTNTRFSFTLKYPASWAVQSVDEASGAESSAGDRIIFWSKENYKSLIPEGTEWAPTETLYQFVVKANDGSRLQHLLDPNITLTNSESATIDGETGTKDTFRGPYGEWVTIYVTHNKVAFGVQIPQLTNEQKQIANQILSTFQFTD